MKTFFNKDFDFKPDREMRQSPRPSLNRLCDMSDWKMHSDLDPYLRLAEGSVNIHRKGWEYAMCMMGADKFGLLNDNSNAIGVGAGSEFPLYYFANKMKMVAATDLYTFEGHEGDPEVFKHPERFAPFPYRKDHLTFYMRDAVDLQFPDNSFNYAFSLSSIEHFGSRANQKKAMQEIYRVLTPGGVACISTELILNNTRHSQYFTLKELQNTVINSTHLTLAGGDLDLSISRSTVLNPLNLNTETNLQSSPHIVLEEDGVIWTSVILFLKK
ncbi:MAG: class I SAM-dependent methyltransferase [Pirellulaceae bacterium]